MRFLKHLVKLLQSIVGFARQNKVWWMVPLVVVLLVLAIVLVAGQAVAPFIYTLF